MANATYDTLTITIEADSSKANQSLKALSKNLQSLDNTAKNLDLDRIEEVKGLLLDIASIDFSNVSKGLQDVVSAFKSFQSKGFMRASNGGVNLTPMNGNFITGNGNPRMSMLDDVNFESVADDLDKYINQVVKAFNEQEAFKNGIEEVRNRIIEYNSTLRDTSGALDNILLPLERLGTTLAELGFNGRQWEEVFASINYETNKFSPEQIEQVRRELLAFGKSAEEVEDIISRLKLELDNMPANNLDRVAKTMQDIGLNSKQVSSVLSSIKYESSSFDSTQIENVKNALSSMGYSADEVEDIISRLSVEMEELDTKTKKTTRTLAMQFKNILKYRIIRKLIQTIYKTFSDGITAIANFDSATSDAIAEIRASFNYITNSLGSALAPLLQMVAPLLSSVADVIGDVGNTLGEVFATLNGQTQFAQAKKDVDAYRKSLEKTQSIGIDELNVIQQDTGSFEYVDVEQVERVSGIKDLLGSMATIIKDISSLLMPVLKDILVPIFRIVSEILSLVKQLLDNVFGKLGTTLQKFGSLIAKIFNLVENIVMNVVSVLQPVIDIISTVINLIVEQLSVLFDISSGVMDVLTPIVNTLLHEVVPVLKFIFTLVSTIFYVLEAMINSFVHFSFFQWDKIASDWDIAGKVSASWSRFGNNTFASGGFPEDGLFFANHTELVGRFENGRTAVANNEQITDGIYRAVKDAMLETNRGSVSINLDGYDVAKVITKRQDNMSSFVKGGNLNYAK